MIDNLLAALQRFAWSLLLVGLLTLGTAAFLAYASPENPTVLAQEQLSVSVGEVLAVVSITAETRGLLGNKVARPYTQLMVRPDLGSDQKWLVDPQVPKAALDKLQGRRAQAKLDLANSNLVYVMASEGEFLLTYDQMLAALKAQMQAQVSNWQGILLWAAGSLLLLLSAYGIWLRYKLEPLDPRDSRDFQSTQIH
jgi:hypothetical protein